MHRKGQQKKNYNHKKAKTSGFQMPDMGLSMGLLAALIRGGNR